MRRQSLLVTGLALALAAGCAASDMRARMQVAGFTNTDPVASAAQAPPKAVDPAQDIVNIEAARMLTIGMLVEIHVAPRTLEITHAGMMMVRREPRGQDIASAARNGRAPADWIVLQAMGDGALISQAAVSDTGINIAEGAEGDVAVPDRTLLVSLPTPRRVDTLVVISTTSGEVVRVDAKRIMDEYCAANPAVAPCRGQ